MEKSNKVYLEDIVEAIKLILEDYASGINFEEFTKTKRHKMQLSGKLQ